MYARIEDKLSRYMVFGFMRELCWIHKRRLLIEYFEEKYTLEVFCTLDYAESSVSRIGLIQDILSGKTKPRIEKLYNLVKEKWDKYWGKIMQVKE